MSDQATFSKPRVLVTYRILTNGDAFKKLSETCEVRFHDGADLMTREELLRAVPGVDGVLIQNDQFDLEAIEAAGKNGSVRGSPNGTIW